MPDSSGHLATSSSNLTDLTLSVRIDGHPEQEVFLQHGLSIGRNLSNTICVNQVDVERIHAMVCRQSDGTMLLECTDDHLRVTLADESKAHSVPLKPGTTFKLGTAVIRCLKRETRPTVVVSDNPWEVRCPRCHETIIDLSHDATHCPKCNIELQYFKSHSGEAGTGGPETFRSTSEFSGWLPREIGPYRIRAFVAQGGMGIILRGLHKENDLPAAVKLLKLNSDEDPTWKQRFIAEIDTLQALRHPNVVRLQDHGKDDRLLWLAMDWIDGQPLTKMAVKARQDGKDLPIDEIRTILLQVVAGLEYLHGKQIIHRDLKPSNVLMSRDALVKLVDFGIARAASGQTAVVTQLTHTGMVAGTESYMAPEQAEGQNVGPSADIYSLGVMWYELVTGRRPMGAFMAPHLQRNDCPLAWSNLIAQCLQVNPAARPSLASIATVLETLAAEPPPLPGRKKPGTGVIAAPVTGQQPWQPPTPTQPHVPVTPVTHGPGTTVNPPPPGGPTVDHVPPPPPPTGVHRGPQGAGGSQQTVGNKAAEVASQAGHAIAGAAKTTAAAVSTFFQKNPPAKWLEKAGPAGDWVKKHKGPSIAIGAGVFLILLILIIRGCSGNGTPTAGGTGTGGTPDGNVNNNPINNNNPTVRDLPVQQTPEMQFAAGQMLINQARSFDDEKFTRGYELVTQSANRGHSPAMIYLARYGLTQGAPYPYGDRTRAIQWARKAQAAGDPQAAGMLMQLGVRP